MISNIMVIKHGALGDIIQGLDAFASLRATFPAAHIQVLTTPAFAPFMDKMPYFDDILIDHRAKFWQISHLRSVSQMFSRNLDIVIDMQCSSRTERYHKWLAPKGTRWFGTARGCSDPYPDFTKVNNRDRMLSPVLTLGGKSVQADLSFLGADTLNAFDLRSSYAVLMPGCSPAKPSKKWPASHYADLADKLHKDGLVPVVVGTKHDEQACHIISSAHDFVINLCGRTDLPTLASLCAGAAYCIGNDSGPVFLAAKTGAPTMMVMGPDTNPDMSAPHGPKATYLKADDLSELSATDLYHSLKR